MAGVLSKSGAMNLRLMSVITSARKNGSPTSTYADMRPIAVSERMRRELLTLPYGLGDHVEERCERAADLTLDRDRGDHEREVLRADAVGHLDQRVLHRAAELRIGQHALELGAAGSIPSSTTDWMP